MITAAHENKAHTPYTVCFRYPTHWLLRLSILYFGCVNTSIDSHQCLAKKLYPKKQKQLAIGLIFYFIGLVLFSLGIAQMNSYFGGIGLIMWLMIGAVPFLIGSLVNALSHKIALQSNDSIVLFEGVAMKPRDFVEGRVPSGWEELCEGGGSYIFVSRDEDSDTTVFMLGGEIELHASINLDERFRQFLDTESARQRLAIDCQQIYYLDSSGLRSFMRADKLFKEMGREFVFNNLNDATRKLFEVTWLINVFKLLEGPDIP